ncbi:MAG: sugar phosphate isomerase/epimerase [Acidobacteriaceae bacterium]|nr:sugar phosphate isomerase/epimerase [Acidobacteriaceae bacterium]
MTRRAFLHTTAATLATQTLMADQTTEPAVQYKMGIAATSYMGVWRPKDTYEFLEHCHTLGAAGIQSAFHGDLAKIRARAEQLGMYIEGMVPMPKGNDTGAFEEALKNAKDVGAVAVRSDCLGTRRYETFHSLEDWKEHVAESKQSIAAAVPLLERYKIPLGLENHKDWTLDEAVALFEAHSSEYFGSCVDFGNNIALLDQPMEVIKKLAPFAVCTHLKNMAVEPYQDGFLLSEVLLGDGYLDLNQAVATIRQHRPKVRFSLEMITRDPLEVPCLNDDYWITFPDRNGLYLARTLRFVNEHHSSQPLPRVSHLKHEEAMRVEEQNVVTCLRWAHQNLGL